MSPELEYAWKIKEYILQNIQSCDSKANAVITISTVSIALLTFLPQDISQLEAIIVALSSLVLLVSIILAILTFFPRTYPRYNQGIIFWGNISTYQNYEDYRQDFNTSNQLDEVLKQVYCIAIIANYKYACVSKAIKLQIIGLVVFWTVILGVRVF